MKKCIAIGLIGLILSGCSIIRLHKPDIEQGNIILPQHVSHLHVGMDENQVIAIMGHPVLTNIFSNTRFDYVYTFQAAYGSRTEKRLTCIFEQGRLKEITMD